jgi:hypothetical protein
MQVARTAEQHAVMIEAGGCCRPHHRGTRRATGSYRAR